MYRKECRICGSSFMAKTERRQLCDTCQKNSSRAQKEIDKAIYLDVDIIALGDISQLYNEDIHAAGFEYAASAEVF